MEIKCVMHSGLASGLATQVKLTCTVVGYLLYRPSLNVPTLSNIFTPLRPQGAKSHVASAIYRKLLPMSLL